MGIEYYLVDRTNKRQFDLGKGKGNWTVGFGDAPCIVEARSPIDLRGRLAAAWDATHTVGRDWAEFLDGLTVDVWAFILSAGGTVWFADENEYDWEQLRTVGSRYENDEDVQPDPLAETVAWHREEARAILGAFGPAKAVADGPAWVLRCDKQP